LTTNGIIAPWLLDGPMNAAAFLTYVQTALIPEARPGSIIIADNLGSHKGSAVRQAVRDAGLRLWFLPPYSPDLNPIEKFFSKLKHWLRHAQERSFEALHQRIKQILQSVCPDECAAYFASCNY
jgi:transposase